MLQKGCENLSQHGIPYGAIVMPFSLVPGTPTQVRQPPTTQKKRLCRRKSAIQTFKEIRIITGSHIFTL
uniref:Uncharacterized protein n=1 Tax=Anguilla anguilla TaxID=7936 RepID=A0A0E9VDA6_ANGAN